MFYHSNEIVMKVERIQTLPCSSNELNMVELDGNFKIQVYQLLIQRQLLLKAFKATGTFSLF